MANLTRTGSVKKNQDGPGNTNNDYGPRKPGFKPPKQPDHYAPEDPGQDYELDWGEDIGGFTPGARHKKSIRTPVEDAAYDESDRRVLEKWDMLRDNEAFVEAAHNLMAAKESGDLKAQIRAMLALKGAARPTVDQWNSLHTGGTGNPAPRGSQDWPTPKSPLGTSTHDPNGGGGGALNKPAGGGFLGDIDNSYVDEDAARAEGQPGFLRSGGSGNFLASLSAGKGPSGFGKPGGGASTGLSEANPGAMGGKKPAPRGVRRGGGRVDY